MTRRYTRVLITLLQLGWTWVLDPSEIILPRAAFVSSLREVYDQFNSREKERERESWEIGSKLGRGDEDVVKKGRSKYSNLINKCIWDDSYVGMIRGRRRANNYCYWIFLKMMIEKKCFIEISIEAFEKVWKFLQGNTSNFPSIEALSLRKFYLWARQGSLSDALSIQVEIYHRYTGSCARRGEQRSYFGKYHCGRSR